MVPLIDRIRRFLWESARTTFSPIFLTPRLDEKQIDGELVLFDEAHDSNPVILDPLAQANARYLLVDDRYQQIYV